jgi:hypothetical protein
MFRISSFILALLLVFAAPALAQTTVASTTLTTNDSGDNATSSRTLTPSGLSSANLGQFRVTLAASTAATTGCGHVSVGISTGTGTNTTATPIEMLFSGASGVTMSASATATSDWNSNALSWNTSTDKLVVICDHNTSAARISTTSTGWAALAANGCGGLAGVTYNVADVTGTCGTGTNAGWSMNVVSIETQSAGGVVVPLLMMMGVGK